MQENRASLAVPHEDQLHSHINTNACFHAHIYSTDLSDDKCLNDQSLNDDAPEHDAYHFLQDAKDDVRIDDSITITYAISNRNKPEGENYNFSSNQFDDSLQDSKQRHFSFSKLFQFIVNM